MLPYTLDFENKYMYGKSWYGPSCKYQCHCAGSASCDEHDGSCSSGCEQGWFGAACQYGSIGFTVLENSTLDWLTDQDDTTCNDNKETHFYLTLKTPVPLKWSRIVVNSPGLEQKMHFLNSRNSGRNAFRDVKLFYYIKNEEKTMECSGPKVSISDTMQDILCPTADNVTKVTVTINGEASRGLCSLYLSTACAVGNHVNNVLESSVIGKAEHVFQAVSQGIQEQSVVKNVPRENTAKTVIKAAVFTVLDKTIPVLISMEPVLKAVIQATWEKHVTRNVPLENTAKNVIKAAVFTVVGKTISVLISMEPVLKAVIQATQRKHVTRNVPLENTAKTVLKAAVFTVLDKTIPVLISMEHVLKAVIKAIEEKNVTRASMQKNV
ncbi:hypothetical protein RRG08_051507 [Elysia crispata]|uniref:Uncharacterized protein n=1 Tax=Elysia crispata TaxID=231223 RepID=A0AAE1AM59_9GAST|nr:hypothetical protein RRG08_051507 [Elysia crispata]